MAKTSHSKHSVTAGEVGQRFDKVLSALIPQLSRTKVQALIVAGAALVNDKAVAKHYFLEEGDVIMYAVPEEKKLTKVVRPTDFMLNVLHEDDDVVVVEKPVGLLTHAAESTHEWTLADELLKKYPDIKGVGDSEERFGIVHRLDRDVSGVMVVARTQEAFENLKKQFQDRVIEKEYRAVVHGVPHRTHDDIRFVITRSTMDPSKMAARPENAEGKSAWTEYDVLRSHRNLSELRVLIHTGRTHQIRAHLLAISHPVVGDTLYTSKQYESNKSFDRLYLHAHRLTFTHLKTAQKVEFLSEIPTEFDQLMTS
ncbi:MAG: RluA family pseudouridine synthase [Candidatus Kerfeldbacteria bacterium]|nr:RluA family pseudouridine synthase [Candidatus Kerfeldbacteria bacterium]